MAEGSRKRQRLDSLIESAKDIYNENETRRKENLHLQNEVTRLKLDIGELEVAKIDLAEVKKQLSHKSQECTERELDIARITKHNEEEATRSKTNLVAHEKVKMDLAQVQGELDQKNQECARRELDVLRLQGEITRSKAGLVEFEKVKNDLIQVRTTLEEKSQECARRELDVAQITKSNRQKRAVIKSHNAMRVEIGRFQSIHDQLRSSIVQLRTDNSKIDNDRQELEVKNARLGAKAARLEQEAEDRIEDMGSKIGEIRKLKQQIDEFRHRDSATGEDGIAIVRNEPGHEDESDLIEVTAAQSQSTYLGTASGNGFGSTDPSTVLVFRNATDWDARIAAMSREKLVELYKQIFEILCTFNAHPQASLKSTILSALTGNMVSKLSVLIAQLLIAFLDPTYRSGAAGNLAPDVATLEIKAVDCHRSRFEESPQHPTATDPW